MSGGLIALGVILTLVIFGFIYVYIEGINPAPSKEKPSLPNAPQRETYGFPFSPFDYVKRDLPEAPDNYKWDLSIYKDEKGDLVMRLGLLSLFTGEIESEKIVSLVGFYEYWVGTKSWNTYAYYIEKFPRLLVQKMDYNIKMKLISWAKERRVEKHSIPDGFEHEVI